MPIQRSPLRLFLAMMLSRLRGGPHSAVYRKHYRQWKFREIRHRFTARSSFENYTILHRIAFEDEYDIAHERFSPDDVVIDIGAHIGVFSYMAHVMGSRAIHAFEADGENHGLLRRNLGTLPGVHVHHNAVVRSDAHARPDVVHSGYIEGNTGGGNVIMGGRAFEFYKQEIVERTPATAEVRIPAIRLDDILSPFDTVKLIKIDCEGSEFPILLTSRLLHRVERIVGEYHEIEAQSMSCLDPGAVVPGFQDYRKEHLAAALENHGFHVTFKESARCLGMFNAVRTRARPSLQGDAG